MKGQTGEWGRQDPQSSSHTMCMLCLFAAFEKNEMKVNFFSEKQIDDRANRARPLERIRRVAYWKKSARGSLISACSDQQWLSTCSQVSQWTHKFNIYIHIQTVTQNRVFRRVIYGISILFNKQPSIMQKKLRAENICGLCQLAGCIGVARHLCYIYVRLSIKIGFSSPNRVRHESGLCRPTQKGH